MDTLLLVVLMLALWPASFVMGKFVPERGKRFLLLLLAFISTMRFVQLVKGGGVTIASAVFAVLAVAFLFAGLRRLRHNAAKADG